MKRRFFAGCLVLVSLVFPLHAEDSKDKAATVPFELLKTRHMAVMMKVNGKGPYRLIFDTGAPVVLLNSKIGKQAGLVKGKQPVFSLFNAAGQVKVDKLELGDLTAENVSAVVMDHPTVEAISKALGPIDGIEIGRAHV